MDHFLGHAASVQPALDVGQATGIAGDYSGRPAQADVLELAGQHGAGNLRVFRRKYTTEPAAITGVGQLDELSPPDGL